MSVEVKIEVVEVRERSRKEMRGIDVLAEFGALCIASRRRRAADQLRGRGAA